ncbi:MAG: helix-turn-helix domain-containing protein [Bacteroidota bacterium]
MEQADKVILSFEKNFDKHIFKISSYDALDKFEQLLLLQLEIIRALKADSKETKGKKDEVEDKLTVKQVSKEYGISITTLYKLIRENKIRCFRLGNKIRLKRKDIEAYQSGSEFDM